MSNGPAPALEDRQLAAYVRQAGFPTSSLVTMVAIILGESGGDPDNVGDEDLVDGKWGPSIGLGQVRSLRAETGTGGPRDATRLTDPAFNLRSALEISGGGTNFKPWSAFTSGRYRQYLARAWAAVAGAPQTPTGARTPMPADLQGLAGIDLPGGGLVDKAVEPFLEGLRRITLVGVILAGGVALVAAGGWKLTAPVRETGKEMGQQVASVAAVAAA